MAEEFNSKFANVVSDLNISFDWDIDPEIEAIKDPIKRSIQKFQKHPIYIKDQGQISKPKNH